MKKEVFGLRWWDGMCVWSYEYTSLLVIKRLWNQRPLHRPAANRGCLLKEVNRRLGLESCSNKDFNPPCPTPLAPKEMLPGWVWGFLFSRKLLATGRAAFDGLNWRRKWRQMGSSSCGGHCVWKRLSTPILSAQRNWRDLCCPAISSSLLAAASK